MDNWHCMLFEARSIQTYLMASGRLRDTIWASELIDLMTRGEVDGENQPISLIDGVLKVTPGGEHIQFSRRAAGALYAFCEQADVLRRFAMLWTLVVQHWTPALPYVLGWGSGQTMVDAFDRARADLPRQASRTIPDLPVPAPPAARTPRTGRVAVRIDDEGEVIDAASARSRLFAESRPHGLLHRYSPPEAHLDWRDWPRNLEPREDGGFPFLGESRSVALLRGDANGMGQALIGLRQVVRRLPERFVETYQAFSAAIDASTRFAAQQATREVLLPAREAGHSRLLAARPILLGGDDLIVLIRADLALDYARCFARAFEEKSRSLLCELPNGHGATHGLTISFGISFVRANQPFSTAVALAESLMDWAKQRAGEHAEDGIAASSLVFHRASGSLDVDYEDIVPRELTRYDGAGKTGTPYVHTLGAYALGRPVGAMPALDDLLALHALLRSEDMARGPARKLLYLLQLDPSEARWAWRRWRRLMSIHDGDLLERFDDCMARLIPSYRPEDDAPGPYGRDRDRDAYRSPLGDALTLLRTQRDGAASNADEAAS